MNWHEELLKRGFEILESSTKTYGYGNIPNRFIRSLVYENSKGNIVDEESKDVKEIFCPFLHSDDERKPNTNFQTIRLRGLEDLDNFIVKKQV